MNQAELLERLRPDTDRVVEALKDRRTFEEAHSKLWAAAEVSGNGHLYARAAQLRLSSDKMLGQVLEADKNTPARDLGALNLVELQVLAYYTSLVAGDPLDMTGCDPRSTAVIDLLRGIED